MKRFLNWLCGSPGTKPSPSRRPASVRLQLEALEDRRVLSVNYHGGWLVQNVKVETVFYGDAWLSDPQLISQSIQLNNFFADITNSTYMDMLGEYGVGRGTFSHTDFVPLSQPFAGPFVGFGGPLSITDQSIRDMLDENISDPNSTVSYPDPNTLYVVYTPPNVSVDYAANNGFLGYHYSFVDSRGELVNYAVVTYPSSVSSPAAFDTVTSVSSHEMAEAVTDPNGQGWFDDNQMPEGEIGDLVNQQGRLDGYVVQALWSTAQQGPVLPYDATWLPGDSGAISAASEPTALPGRLQPVASALSHSDEYYANFITAAYQRYLGRSPDAAGLASWVAAMRNGLSDERLEAGFVGSPEYIAEHGGSGAGWVRGMYLDLLGRTPSPPEVQNWVNLLNQGMSPQAVAYGFSASVERESQRVRADYQQFLGRQASQAEVAAWVAAFEHGVSNEEVVAGFVGSPENFHDHHDNIDAWLEGAYQAILGRDADVGGLENWRLFLQ